MIMTKPKEEIKQDLTKFFEDRLSVPVSKYKESGKKEKGVSSGFVGSKDGSTYMLKTAHLQQENGPLDDGTDAANKQDFMAEYMMSPLYNRLLYGAAPVIGLANEAGSEIYLKSKFLDNFQLLYDAIRDDLSFSGFEKVIATSLFLGEIDYHNQNLGVVTTQNGEKQVVKIDHGRSAENWWNARDESTIMYDLYSNIPKFYYQDIPFSVSEFKDMVDNIDTISENEIESLIGSQSDKLKKTGFKPNAKYNNKDLGYKIIFTDKIEEPQEGKLIVSDSQNKLILQIKGKDPISVELDEDNRLFYQSSDGERKEFPMTVADFKRLQDDSVRGVELDNLKDKLLEATSSIGYSENEIDLRYKKLEEYYIENLKENKKIFEDLGKTLDIIVKIDADEKWKNGQWIESIYGNSKKQDPIIWAFENNKTIEGKDPITWASENNKIIEGKDPITWKREFLLEQVRIKGRNEQEFIKFAKQSGKDRLLEELFSKGVDPSFKDDQGKKASDYAKGALKNKLLYFEKLYENKDKDLFLGCMYICEINRFNTVDKLKEKLMEKIPSVNEDFREKIISEMSEAFEKMNKEEGYDRKGSSKEQFIGGQLSEGNRYYKICNTLSRVFHKICLAIGAADPNAADLFEKAAKSAKDAAHMWKINDLAKKLHIHEVAHNSSAKIHHGLSRKSYEEARARI